MPQIEVAEAVKTVKYNFLGLAIGVIPPTKANDNDLIQVKTEFDKKTGSTHPVEEKLDFQKMIESYKDEAGIDFMMKQVKLGALSLSSLADDGKHSADISNAPEHVDDAYQRAVVAKSDANKIYAALGVDANATPEQIKEALAKIYAKAHSEPAKKEEVKDNAQ